MTTHLISLPLPQYNELTTMGNVLSISPNELSSRVLVKGKIKVDRHTFASTLSKIARGMSNCTACADRSPSVRISQYARERTSSLIAHHLLDETVRSVS